MLIALRPGCMSKSFALRSNGPAKMQDDEDEEALVELNDNLSILATIFPRILPEVFRELLHAFDGGSQLQIAVEQLLKYQDQWVRGRWRTNFRGSQAEATKLRGVRQPITVADEFRRASYKWAARKLLYEEFKVLSRSKIEAVLAEENFCYSRARPTLQKLASKTWRNTVSALISKWRKPTASVSKDHYALVWLPSHGEEARKVPTLKETGDIELDTELHDHVLGPLLERIKSERESRDWDAAISLNETEAKHAGVTYECECCYSDTTFEQMATCTAGGHTICFQCIWHAVSEALFGQSWGRNIEHGQGQLKCLAPVPDDSCEGHIPQAIARRAILQRKGGKEALAKLETHLAEEAVSKSGLALVHCPFCSYVEVDELYIPSKAIRYRLDTAHLKLTFLLLIAMLNFLPLILLLWLASRFPPFRTLPHPKGMFSQSLTNLARGRLLSRRFQCCSPSCGLPSCLTCLKAWNDPHICHESATLSLRKTVEAARTSALKRTCPRCGLGFIKDSGCNKLTCICGYSMCYICRQGLGKGGGGEGYRHFCQHFRATGGSCKECDKCDLYKKEDDEGLVRKAGALAEKEWREREGMMGVEGIGVFQESAASKPWWNTDWTVQDLFDWWVKKVLTC